MKERKTCKTRILLFIAAAFIFSVTTINVNAEAAEVSPTPTPESISILKTSKSAREIEEYWTEERMENAIPMPNPEISEEEFQRLINTPQEEESKSQEESKSVESSVGESEVMVYTAGVPTRANVNQHPFRTGGKFFFTKPDGYDYVCSAEFVGSSRVIMTAAHCLRSKDTGEWYSDFLFRRAYENGGGQAVVSKCPTVWSDWVVGSDKPDYYWNWKRDYGFLYAERDSSGGWLGLRTLIPYSTWTAIGYPSNYGSNKYMYKVDGSKGTVENGIVEMKDNPMRSGNGGGAWIGDLKPHAGGNYAIGLNSFHRSDPTSEFGPYFDSNTFSLFEYAAKNPCK